MGACGSRGHLPIPNLRVDSAMSHLSDRNFNSKKRPIPGWNKSRVLPKISIGIDKKLRDNESTHYDGNH